MGGGDPTTAVVSFSLPQTELITSDAGAVTQFSSADHIPRLGGGAHTHFLKQMHSTCGCRRKIGCLKAEGGVGWGFTTAEEKGTGVNHSSLMSLPEVGEIIHDNLIKTPSPHVVGKLDEF